MRIAAILFIFPAAFLISTAAAQTDLTNPIPDRNPKTSAADVAAGRETFHSHCSPCHGYNAEGGIGPNLAAGVFYHGSADADLYRNISHGIAGTEMPGIFYNGDRIWQVVAFIRSLHVPDQRPAGVASRGAAIYASSSCASCHRINGVGGSLGPDLSNVGAFRSVAYLKESILTPDASVDRKYWVASFDDGSGRRVRGFVENEDTYTVQILDLKMQLHSYDRVSIRNFKVEKTSPMPSYKGRLSAEQLQDLIAYLWTLRPSGTLLSENVQ